MVSHLAEAAHRQLEGQTPGFAGRFVMAGPVATRFYADPGTTISVSAISGSGGPLHAYAVGYLVECDVTEGCALR